MEFGRFLLFDGVVFGAGHGVLSHHLHLVLIVTVLIMCAFAAEKEEKSHGYYDGHETEQE